MNIFKAIFSRPKPVITPSVPDPAPVAPSDATANVELENVITFWPRDGGPSSSNDSNLLFPQSPLVSRLPGLLDCAELVKFQTDNYFGLGCHNGAHYRTQEALEQGRLGIIARFQRVIETLIEKKTSELYRLQDTLLETEGLNRTVEKRLNLACERVSRDLAELKSQKTLADEGKGWVLDALNRYQIGYQKGLKESVQFDLLTTTRGGAHK